MALKTDMTWEKAKLRWRKMYRGKVYTVSCEALGVPATKEASYQAANAWWKRKRTELDGNVAPHPFGDVIGKLEFRRDWCRRHHRADEAAEWSRRIEVVRKLPVTEDTDPCTALVSPSVAERIEFLKRVGGLIPEGIDPLSVELQVGDGKLWEERYWTDRAAEAIPDDKTLGGQVKAWLAGQEAKVQAGQISPGQYNNVRYCLHHFRDILGGEMLVEVIDETKLASYYMKLLAEVSERRKDSARKAGMSRDYAAKHFAVARKFVRFLWSMGLIELPKNIDSREFTFRRAPRTVPTMTKEEVRTLVEKATGQLKLHLLLMVNCGMTQTDIAELKDGEVDWEAGRIIRKRSKTEEHDDVPVVVNYKLWPETFRLLKQYRSGRETVLLTRNGTVWAWESIVDGKYQSNDSIATNYNHLKAKLKRADKSYAPKPLKLLRKTSVTLIESSDEHGRFVSHFLGHSPRTIKDKHYAAPATELFDAAVEWLGRQYGFVP